MDLTMLKAWIAALVVQAFRPGIMANNVRQASCFVRFCNNYSIKFINPMHSTLCYFITHLSSMISSSKSVRNYVSGVHFLHKQLNSFQVSSFLQAPDFTMRTAPLRCLPILPHDLTQLCHLSDILGSLGPAMKVCPTFRFLGMLRQSNLAPPSGNTFNPSRHFCSGDIFLAHSGVFL